VHTLKAALNHAFQNEANRIRSDKPWRSLKTYTGAGGSREHHFSEPQVQRLIDEARRQDLAFALLLEAAFWTGARYGELTRLLVGNYDARRRQLLFPKAITKTAKARSVLLVPEACEFFSKITRERDKAEVMLLRSDGATWGKSHQARPMKAALKAARLDTAASFYALRHTVASRMIENGAPLTLVAEQLGTSPRMLAEQYAHLLAERERAIVNETAPRLKVIQGGRRVAQERKG
jgi:integrase